MKIVICLSFIIIGCTTTNVIKPSSSPCERINSKHLTDDVRLILCN